MDMQAWGTILRLLFLPWDHRVQHGRGSPPIFFLIFVGPYLKKRNDIKKQNRRPSLLRLHYTVHVRSSDYADTHEKNAGRKQFAMGNELYLIFPHATLVP